MHDSIDTIYGLSNGNVVVGLGDMTKIIEPMTGKTIKQIEMGVRTAIEHKQEIFMGIPTYNQVIISDLEGNIKYEIDTKLSVETLCMTTKGKLIIGQSYMWIEVAAK